MDKAINHIKVYKRIVEKNDAVCTGKHYSPITAIQNKEVIRKNHHCLKQVHDQKNNHLLKEVTNLYKP